MVLIVHVNRDRVEVECLDCRSHLYEQAPAAAADDVRKSLSSRKLAHVEGLLDVKPMH
jgi:hypothetical protein